MLANFKPTSKTATTTAAKATTQTGE